MATDAKKSLRKSMKSKLSRLREEDVDRQSRNAQQMILKLQEYQAAKSVSVYLSMPKFEAQTDLIVRDALQNGKDVFVPFIHKPANAEGESENRSIIDMLQLRSVHEYEHLVRDSWGIPSLPADGVQERRNAMGGQGSEGSSGASGQCGLNFVVVPGVAFDAKLNRLGHGAGFYDEYFSRYSIKCRREPPYLVGLCLSEQYLDGAEDACVPTNDRDHRMDAVVIGDGRLVSSETA